MRDFPQFEDLGLDPEADRTEDLRPGKSDVVRAATPTTSEPSTPLRTEIVHANHN